MTKRRITQFSVIIALLAIAIAATVYVSSMSNAEDADKEQKPEANSQSVLQDNFLGAEDAPVTMYEFASLSCPHCADFHTETLPRIKDAYIDTGKVKLVFIDFPLNAPAMMGSVLAQCMPETRYFKFLNILFENQKKWAFASDKTPLEQFARLGGLSQEEIDQCLENGDVQKALLERAQEYSTKFEIKSTPSFILNDGIKKIEGARDFPFFAAQIEELLKGI